MDWRRQPLPFGEEGIQNVTLRYVPTIVHKRKPATGTASRRAALTHDEMEPEPEVREIYKLQEGGMVKDFDARLSPASLPLLVSP